MTLLPVVLIPHVALALLLFVPSLLLPFALRENGRALGRATRALLWLQGPGGVIVGLGVALTGVLLVLVLGLSLLSQPWLLLALALYAMNLTIAFFIQRPAVRSLLGMRTTQEEADRRRWRMRAARQRYVSYAMGTIVGLIGLLMAAKPRL